MKTTITILLTVLALCPQNLFALQITLGKTRTIETPAQARIHVGSRKIIKVIDRGDSIAVVGVKIGTTDLIVGEQTFRVVVTAPGSGDFQKSLEELFKERMGLKVASVEGQVVVSGKIHVFKDWLEIAEQARDRNQSYLFRAQPDGDVLEEATRYFLETTKELGLRGFRIGKELPLTVHVNTRNEDEFKTAEDFFTPFGFRVKKNKDILELKPLIKTSVILAEVSKQASSSFGFQFPTQVEGQVVPALKGPSELMISLKALESRGLGKVLASPTLTCRSEGVAEFHAGGEFPIKLTGFRKQDVEWKKHGVMLKVKPKADENGSIQLSMETEISLVDTAQVVDGLPALKTNRVSSHFDLKHGTTIALSGLIQETWGRGQSGLFGFSQIPVLGALFRSEDFLNNKSEMVVFVTPEIVEADQAGSIQWPEGWGRDEL